MSECTCGEHFMDPEDFRDHLPCLGTAEQQIIRELRAQVTQLKDDLKQARTVCRRMLRRVNSLVQGHSVDAITGPALGQDTDVISRWESQ